MSAPLKLSPYCTDLCSKKVMMSEGLPMTESDVLDASNAVWCSRTMQLLGPDREVAAPADCQKGRDCFQSPFEDLL